MHFLEYSTGLDDSKIKGHNHSINIGNVGYNLP